MPRDTTHMLFLGYRKDRMQEVLVWNPHYHVLGFIAGGFDVCRNCVHERGDCRTCRGFKGREVREYENDGYIVKCFEKRKTVIGTAFYQLNHASLRVGIRRFHVVTWFGVCGYSKMKGKKVKAVVTCPACHSEMVRKHHWGKRVIARDIGDPLYQKWFVDDEFDESGLPNYVDAVWVVGLSSGSSERRREPQCWLNFDDVAHCRNVESFNAFVEQFLSERGLVGESRRGTYWALFYRWKKVLSSDS